MSFPKHARIIEREAREAARLSHIHVDLVGAGKHLCLKLDGNGKHRRLAVSCTPKNTHTAVANALKQVRRVIGEMS